MKGLAYLLVAVVAMTGVVVYMAHASERPDGEADPVFGITIPPGYRDWKLISVALSLIHIFRTLLRDVGFEIRGAWKDGRGWYTLTLACVG